MRRLVYWPFAYNDVRCALQYGLYQLCYIFAAVLVICVGIYDYVRAVGKAGVKPRHEAFCQALVAGKVHHMMHAPVHRHFHGLVRAAVIDDEVFDLVDAVDMLGQVV